MHNATAQGPGLSSSLESFSRLYQIIFGCDPNFDSIDGILVDGTIAEVAKALIGSPEFMSVVHEPMMAGNPVTGPLFDRPPERELVDWAAAHLPLSEPGRARVTGAESWHDLHRAIFGDATFRLSVDDQDLTLRQLGDAPPPIRIDGPDVIKIYRLFLGRDPEFVADLDQDFQTASGVFVRDVLKSPEFMSVVHEPMMAGNPVTGPLFDRPPERELVDWAAAHLPLSEPGRARVTGAESWHDLHRAIFGDATFQLSVDDQDHTLRQLGDAPPPIRIDGPDVIKIYRLFLGRDPEFVADLDQDFQTARGVFFRGVLKSPEFMSVVHEPMMAGNPVTGPLFDRPPERELVDWAAAHLPLSEPGRARVTGAESWHDLHRAIFGDATFRLSVDDQDLTLRQLGDAPPPIRIDGPDVIKIYRLFLGRDPEFVADLDQDFQTASGVFVRDVLKSPEFMSVVHEPMMAGNPVTGPLFDRPPERELVDWAAAHLPLSEPGRARVTGAESWHDLHRAIFGDATFQLSVDDQDHTLRQLGDAPPPIRIDGPDVIKIYRLFLGRDPEFVADLDQDFQTARGVFVRGVLKSPEFMSVVHEPMMAGNPVTGPLFDRPPERELVDWAAAHLPLSEPGRARVTGAESWHDLHRAIFGDATFRLSVDDQDHTLGQLGDAPPPISIDGPDVIKIYRLFLGRDPEFVADLDQDFQTASGVFFRDVLKSPEFMSVVHEPMMAGNLVTGPLFDRPPERELVDWAAAHLPLSEPGRARVTGAESWHDLHRAIFGDATFRLSVDDQDLTLRQLGDAPPPIRLDGPDDVIKIYRLFLGRDPEFVADLDQDFQTASGVFVRGVLKSPEFMSVVHEPMMAGNPVTGPLFDRPPERELVDWAAAHLPLSEPGRARVTGAESWRDLHGAIFSDLIFAEIMIKAYRASSGLYTLLLVQDSLLFERDWYLETYRDVAATGGDPLQHYLAHGVSEGRNPNRLFDTRWYLSAYPHVSARRENPLVHYIVEGAKIGYHPHPFFPTEEYIGKYPRIADGPLTPLATYLTEIIIAEPKSFPKFGPYDVARLTEENYRNMERPELLVHIDTMTFLPIFVVLIDCEPSALTDATRTSLSRQIYPHYSIVSSRDEVARASVANKAGSAYLLWMDAGDELNPDALYELASTLNADPFLDLIYFDHEFNNKDGLKGPLHKPDWSPDYFESFDYIGSAFCCELSKSLPLLPDACAPYDLILRFTETRRNIVHLARVLLRASKSPFECCSPQQATNDIAAIEGRLARTDRKGTVTPNFDGFRSYDTKIALRSTPLVSVIIPTAGRTINYDGRRIDLIVACLESITSKSSYKAIEFIIVDNGDFDHDRLSHIHFDRIKFVTYEPAEVNIAKKINLGASHAVGEVVLILNDDIEVIASDWIERMLAHLEKPHVGLVGAKLIFPNGTIQHVGMVSIDGALHHLKFHAPAEDPGYAFSTCGVRNYLSVTGAVSMMRAVDFRRAGGYPEELPIDYNDVDLAYKLHKNGLFAVYEPKALLIHYHAVSVNRPPRPQDTEIFMSRWATIVDDPFYNRYCFSNPPMFELAYSDRKY